MVPEFQCARCPTPAPLAATINVVGAFGEHITVDVRLCSSCKIKAQRENAAAQNRRQSRGT